MLAVKILCSVKLVAGLYFWSVWLW